MLSVASLPAPISPPFHNFRGLGSSVTLLLCLLLAPNLSSVVSLPAPTSPPFQHFRGLGSSVTPCGSLVIDAVLDFGLSNAPDADPLANQKILNAAFASLPECSTLVIPASPTPYRVVGGITMSNLRNATIVIDGSLFFVDDFDSWPLNDNADGYLDGIHVQDSIDLVFTSSLSSSSDTGVILDGNGRTWWDKMIAGTFPTGGDMRPKLFVMDNSADILIEKLSLVNSPSWNLVVDGVRVEIRDVQVITDRGYQLELKDKMRQLRASRRLEASLEEKVAKYFASDSYLPLPDSVKEWLVDEISKVIPKVFLQPEDLNTDGLDPSGADFYVHRVKITNDDDSIAVKPSYFGSVGIDGTPYDCSQNMYFEDMVLTGFGASIGSVPPGVPRKCVDAITMKNVSMPGTGKGIYVKSNGNDCNGDQTSLISNLLFQDFVIEDSFWYSIWIGPQQQHEPNEELGLDCGLAYPLAGVQCPTQGCSTFANITLKDVTILNPKLSPGAILGNSTNPMQNIVFDNVVVKHDAGRPEGMGRFPWHESAFPFKGTFKSEFVQGICVECDPVPDGFVYMTRGEYEATRN